MTIRDASGAIVPTDRCACGRHKEAAKEKCCTDCGTGAHGIGCVLRQESFADTKRGVSVSPDPVELRVLDSPPVHRWVTRNPNLQFLV